MDLIENEIDRKNIDLARMNPELQKRRESEAKYVPTTPNLFDAYKAIAVPIEQIYLSHPDEPFSLRVRTKTGLDGSVSYSGTLKDEGLVIKGKLDRSEIEVKNLSKEAYDFYASQSQFPVVRKLRAEPQPGVTIDFIEGLEFPLLEIEDVEGSDATDFLKEYEDFIENRSDDKSLHNESIAHALHPVETLKPSHETNEAFVERVLGEMVARYTTGLDQVVVGLSGMSGSGKSTMTRLLSERIVEKFGPDYAPVVLSTDDYHFGKQALEEMHGAPYITWDKERTYNLPKMADDLQQLAAGIPIQRYRFDFKTEEPVADGMIAPSPFVILEGLYAGSPALSAVRHLHEDMPTGPATSIGRDVRRLMIENRYNRAFPTPEDRLRYQLEIALPEYMNQKRPKGNSFSAHARPLAARAFMLDQLTAQV